MTFWEHVAATFLGAAIAFVFGIALFYFTESKKRDQEGETARKGLLRECQFNLALFERWEKALQRTQSKISADDHDVNEYIGYTEFLRYYLDRAFVTGILLDRVDDDLLKEVQTTLSLVNGNQETLINTKINEWKHTLTTKSDATQLVNLHLSTIENDVRILRRLHDAMN